VVTRLENLKPHSNPRFKNKKHFDEEVKAKNFFSFWGSKGSQTIAIVWERDGAPKKSEGWSPLREVRREPGTGPASKGGGRLLRGRPDPDGVDPRTPSGG
jgi:hypothetical protein